MLDPDAYGEGGSSSTNPLGNAGKSSGPVGSAGTGTTATAGTSSTGVDPTVAVGICAQYCPGYSSQCKKRLKGQECVPTCQGELNNFGPICQSLGVQALSCLSPFFNRNGGDCDGAVNRALAQCSQIVTQFEDCKKNFATSPSMPVPNRVASCQHQEPVTSGNCTQVFNCSDGPYITFCNPSGQSAALTCTCLAPTGEMVTSRVNSASADPCLEAAAPCPLPRR